MNKTIKFDLSKFPKTPQLLRTDPSIDAPDIEFVVNLSKLYHHYFIDSYGRIPFVASHTKFEYLNFLDNCGDFRFLKDRVSTSVGQKRIISTHLGQAFCRYFLYEFCGITYFAHMDKILDKELHPAFDGMKIKRIAKGDVPDYLCAKSVTKSYITEAKGRFKNISFTSSEFDKWREQFQRIKVYDKNDITKVLKGYIVGTKLTTTEHKSTNRSKIMAEDPKTIGDEDMNENDNGIGLGCISIHYSNIISKLGLQVLSLSLAEGVVISEDLKYSLPVWECNYPTLKGERFIGGYFGDIEQNNLKLGFSDPSFFGISENIFKTLKRVCLGNWNLLSELRELPDTGFRPDNLSWLRDGSITGSLEFFEFVGTETY